MKKNNFEVSIRIEKKFGVRTRAYLESFPFIFLL